MTTPEKCLICLVADAVEDGECAACRENGDRLEQSHRDHPKGEEVAADGSWQPMFRRSICDRCGAAFRNDREMLEHQRELHTPEGIE